MNFKEFQQEAKRTCPDLLTIYHDNDLNKNILSLNLLLYYDKKTESYAQCPEILNLIHTRIGIVTETEELMEAIAKKDRVGVSEELVDKLWYIANDILFMIKGGYIDESISSQIINYKFDQTIHATDCPSINKTLSDWMNAIVYNEVKLLDFIKKYYCYNKLMDKNEYLKRMTYLLAAINNIAVTVKVDLYEGMDKVIAKLRLRFPQNFSSSEAINRDHTAERVILEQKVEK